MAADTTDTGSFTAPTGDTAVAGAIVIGSVVLLVLLARTFRDVAPA